jgi:FkbM family methyltransferase
MNTNNVKTFGLKHLPPFVVSQVRAVKSSLALSFFRPYVARHNYAGFDLSLYITDRIGRLWYDHDWEELAEHTLLRTLKLKKGARVFELGAHQGVVALMVSCFVGDSGSVVALEPGQHNFETALKNKQLNAADNLTILCAAASDRSGEISFSDGMNGRIGYGVNRHAYSVDDLAKEFGTPDVVKIDVEGYELKVLEGATATLAAKPDWYVEVHSGLGLEANGGSPAQIVELFTSSGYRLYIQDDIHYRFPFRPLDKVPNHWFQLVATAD